ncbi:MAG: hypothetical protein MUC97_02050 [Bernardetiaceae bacterium]|nr:hypothetical protein [Bernardetiaceae bacterium]
MGDEYQYFQVKLASVALEQLKQQFAITDSLRQLPPYQATVHVTDQPTTILFLHFDTLQRIAVYGHGARPGPPGAPPHPLTPFFRAYERLANYQNAQATPWFPDTFEVLAIDYSHSSEERPPQWKKRWNDLRSPTTIQRNEQLYSIYLDKKEWPAFLKLFREIEEDSQVVEINGRKFSLSYRWPFPNWR